MSEEVFPLSIAEVIQSSRGIAEITQAELAKRVGCSVGAIRRYEQGGAVPVARAREIADAMLMPRAPFLTFYPDDEWNAATEVLEQEKKVAWDTFRKSEAAAYLEAWQLDVLRSFPFPSRYPATVARYEFLAKQIEVLKEVGPKGD